MSASPPIRTGALATLNLDEAPSYEKLSTCVHCGLCLEACPTYRELRVEMDSPRGRIYLMKGVLTGRLEPSPEVFRHLDQCLDCRACETACPSGVSYAHILERTRTVLQPLRKLGPVARFVRWFFFSVVLPSRRWQASLFRLLWLQQAVGITALARWLGRKRLLPGRLGSLARQAPTLPARSFRQANPGRVTFAAQGERRRKVAFFTGCLADRLFAGINQATIDVLTRNGCEVDVLPAESCCGALHIHNGARALARPLARANIAAFRDGNYDAIVSNAAGCSAELRHYDDLFPDPAEAARARDFAGKIRDVCEYLVEIGFAAPVDTHVGPTVKVAYDEPCHLLHAQKISAPPKAVLDAIPGLERVPLEAADTCCGSAGIYSILEPALSSRIAAAKIDAIAASGAAVVATGNPGCLLQIGNGLREAGLDVTTRHPVELLAEAYAAHPS